jgi:hypothetical protein
LSLLDPRLIASAVRLDRAERAGATRALGWLMAATVAVRVLSYNTITRLIGRIPAARSPRTAMTPVECATAIRRAARIWPAQCLPQAIAGSCLLRRSGRVPTVTLGVAAAEGGRVDAHAWLRCDGVTVTGGGADRHYTPLASARRQAP